MVKDVIASYETLINLFERTQFFLQRLNQYITASLTPELTELLAKILAQVLFVLALSTKEMKERRISVLIYFKYSFLADSSAEKFMKRLTGKADVEKTLADPVSPAPGAANNPRVAQKFHRVNVTLV